MIKTINELPKIKRKSRNVADIDDFVASGQNMAEVDLDGRDPGRAYISLYQAARRRGAPVHVCRRNNRLFLVRKEA